MTTMPLSSTIKTISLITILLVFVVQSSSWHSVLLLPKLTITIQAVHYGRTTIDRRSNSGQEDHENGNSFLPISSLSQGNDSDDSGVSSGSRLLPSKRHYDRRTLFYYDTTTIIEKKNGNYSDEYDHINRQNFSSSLSNISFPSLSSNHKSAGGGVKTEDYSGSRRGNNSHDSTTKFTTTSHVRSYQYDDDDASRPSFFLSDTTSSNGSTSNSSSGNTNTGLFYYKNEEEEDTTTRRVAGYKHHLRGKGAARRKIL